VSILVKNITKRFGEQLAVNNISFELHSGEILGFIGPNGAGKSTTMKMITGYLPPTSGSIEINGINTASYSKDIKRIIGYLPEHNPLYPEMYVKEYLEYAAGLYGLKGKAATKKIEELIDLVGLEKEYHKTISQLSKGYKQRVGISQVLINDPSVLILDEPTSGLDPNQIIEIRNLISSVGKEKTIILSTHIMQEVEAICDRVIIINHGEIMADRKADKNHISFSEDQTIEVELQERISTDFWNQLNNITGVRRLDENRYLLATKSSKDIRPEIFNFAIEHKLTIISLKKLEKSLEEVFKELTS